MALMQAAIKSRSIASTAATSSAGCAPAASNCAATSYFMAAAAIAAAAACHQLAELWDHVGNARQEGDEGVGLDLPAALLVEMGLETAAARARDGGPGFARQQLGLVDVGELPCRRRDPRDQLVDRVHRACNNSTTTAQHSKTTAKQQHKGNTI